MPDHFIEVSYFDHIIIIGIKFSKESGPFESHFTIWGKQRSGWEIDYQGSTEKLFVSRDEAFTAGETAARLWIDEQMTIKG